MSTPLPSPRKISAGPRRRLAALVLLLPLLAACQLPKISYQGEASPEAIDNLARFLTNRAVTAFYEGRDKDVEDALELALEVAPELDEAAVLYKRRYDLRYKPGYLSYDTAPAFPAEREVPGSTLRAILYPIWGFPFDIAELPLKGLLTVPVLGAVAYLPTFLFYPYKERPRRDPEDSGSNVRVGAGVGAATSFGTGVGVGVSSSPVIFFFILNGLPAAVYQSSWEDRLEGWGRCGTWWWPWLAAKLHRESFYPERGIGTAFFPNARRINVTDERLGIVRSELEIFRQVPLEVHNSRLQQRNRIIASLPFDAPRSKVAAFVAEREGAGSAGD